MAEHTKGPWVIEKPYLSEVQTKDNLTVASCWHERAAGQTITVQGVLSCSLEESAANARLIAAAPDLLEALKRAVSQLESRGYDGLSSGAYAAIAKATGEAK